jgi:hypothetical protein
MRMSRAACTHWLRGYVLQERGRSSVGPRGNSQLALLADATRYISASKTPWTALGVEAAAFNAAANAEDGVLRRTAGEILTASVAFIVLRHAANEATVAMPCTALQHGVNDSFVERIALFHPIVLSQCQRMHERRSRAPPARRQPPLVLLLY